MIPSLINLRLHNADISVKSSSNKSKPTPSNLKKIITKRTHQHLDPVYETPSWKAKYTNGVPVDVDDLETLLSIQENIRLENDKSTWIFSSTSQIRALRSNKDDLKRVGMLNAIVKRFANKHGSDNMLNCGSFNCFESNVSTVGTEDWAVALVTVLENLNSGDSSYVIPNKVSIRAPTRSSDIQYDKDATLDETTELALTLFMANKGISVPVLAAVPVKVLSRSDMKTVVADSFLYVTPSGWTDFQTVLNQLVTNTKLDSKTRAAAENSIQNELITLMNLVADQTVLLTDIKLSNMIARQVSDSNEFEIRMIDFGAIFTTQLNTHENSDFGPTAKECAYFLNGLLLLNNALTNPVALRIKTVFVSLATDVVGVWRNMIQNGTTSGFCAYLAKDSVFPQKTLHLRNLSSVQKEDFPRAVRDTFYKMLKRYGDERVLETKQSTLLIGQDPSYINRIVETFAKEFGLQPLSPPDLSGRF